MAPLGVKLFKVIFELPVKVIFLQQLLPTIALHHKKIRDELENY